MRGYSGVKVFSATKFMDREVLGEKITDWLSHRPNITITDTTVTQSSDSEFHCLSIVVFFIDKART